VIKAGGCRAVAMEARWARIVFDSSNGDECANRLIRLDVDATGAGAAERRAKARGMPEWG